MQGKQGSGIMRSLLAPSICVSGCLSATDVPCDCGCGGMVKVNPRAINRSKKAKHYLSDRHKAAAARKKREEEKEQRQAAVFAWA